MRTSQTVVPFLSCIMAISCGTDSSPQEPVPEDALLEQCRRESEKNYSTVNKLQYELETTKLSLEKSKEVLQMIRNDNCGRIKKLREDGYAFQCFNGIAQWECIPEVSAPYEITLGGEKFKVSECQISCGQQASTSAFNILTGPIPSAVPTQITDSKLSNWLIVFSASLSQSLSNISSFCIAKRS